MKFPAADGPSTRVPFPAGTFGADATGGGNEVVDLVDASRLFGFVLVDGAGDSGRGTGGREAEADESGRGATGGAVGTGQPQDERQLFMSRQRRWIDPQRSPQRPLGIRRPVQVVALNPRSQQRRGFRMRWTIGGNLFQQPQRLVEVSQPG